MFGRIGAGLSVCFVVLFAGLIYLFSLGDRRPPMVEQARGDLISISDAFIAYHEDTGVWPPTWDGDPACTWGLDTGYECLFTNACGLPGWAGPYLDREYWTVETDDRVVVFGDPWGSSYVARYFPFEDSEFPNGAILIHSYGPDGLPADTPPNARLEWVPPCDDVSHVVTQDVRRPESSQRAVDDH